MNQCKAIIHLPNFRHNIRIIQELSEGKALCLAVKADAYGHGSVEICKAAEAMGIAHFGVSRVEEALVLRRAGIQARILLFSLPIPDELPLLWKYSIEPLISDKELLKAVLSAAHDGSQVLPVHLKVDTGMSRLGCSPADLPELATSVVASKKLSLAGVATHYPVSDNPNNSFTTGQISAMNDIKSDLETRGIKPEYYHFANSGGILFHSGDGADMVRPGIAAYGYAPDSNFRNLLAQRGIELKPVMELVAPITQIKKIPAGTGVSYGHLWKSNEDTWIATINAGYADGYPRAASGKLMVGIGGKEYPQVGTICMDQCMVDLGPENPAARNIARFDSARLFGHGPGSPTADDLAAASATISYEITCGISSRVPREFLD